MKLLVIRALKSLGYDLHIDASHLGVRFEHEGRDLVFLFKGPLTRNLRFALPDLLDQDLVGKELFCQILNDINCHVSQVKACCYDDKMWLVSERAYLNGDDMETIVSSIIYSIEEGIDYLNEHYGRVLVEEAIQKGAVCSEAKSKAESAKQLKAKKDMLKRVLLKLGYSPKEESRKLISVRYQMKHFYIFVDWSEDSPFIKIEFPAFHFFGEGERPLMEAVCNKMNRSFQMMRVYTDEDARCLHAVYDFLYTSEESVEENIGTAFKTLGLVCPAFKYALGQFSDT